MSTCVLSFDEISAGQLALAGGKGGSLARLYQAGYPVPPGFVILPSAFQGAHLAPEAWAGVQEYLARLRAGDPGISFAVRSSALSEDSASASFAGEFETLLNLQTDEEVHQAVLSVYSSRKNERVQAYSQVKGIDLSQEIAVVVQQLVNAESSGVLFTANPVTGQRDQAMLTAAWGLGESIVSGKVTPDMLIVDKQTGQVLTREIADKTVMTVPLGHGTIEQPVPPDRRRTPVLSHAQVVELVRLGVKIEKEYHLPVDIEWVAVNHQILLVQARPITALPEPEPPPSTWKLPRGQYAAMRNNIVELMPNPLTPLFDTLGREAINASLGRLLTYFIGKQGIMPGDLIISVNGYGYNNGSVRPLAALSMILNVGGILKRMLTGAVERWTEAGRPQYVTAIEALKARPWRQLSSTGLVEMARELYESAIDAYGALIGGVIPAAWISEALFTKFYNLFVRRRGDPSGQTFLLGFDSTPIQAEKSLYELSAWARQDPGLAAYLTATPASRLAAQLADAQALPAELLWSVSSQTSPGSAPEKPQEQAAQPPEPLWPASSQASPPVGTQPGENRSPLLNLAVWQEWQVRFRAHLDRYGHTIYDLDFANPVPADDPTPLLETSQLFIRGQGVDPSGRQRAAVERRDQAQQAVLARLKGWRLRNFRKYLAMAQRFAPLREDGLADVGLGYPLLRQILLELGERFAAGGLIGKPEDIFWLTKMEVLQAAGCLDRGESLESRSAIVIQRKAGWQAARRVTPPMILPQMKLFGVDLAELKSGQGRKLKGSTIKGVATSPGSVTAPACVLHSPEDFARMKTGEVLVASITTPAWTPLFARAAAVVTDVGGPLSHGSIVAREYGIPAVLGTGVATRRIRNGQMITVDGAKGTVFLHDE